MPLVSGRSKGGSSESQRGVRFKRGGEASQRPEGGTPQGPDAMGRISLDKRGGGA